MLRIFIISTATTRHRSTVAITTGGGYDGIIHSRKGRWHLEVTGRLIDRDSVDRIRHSSSRVVRMALDAFIRARAQLWRRGGRWRRRRLHLMLIMVLVVASWAVEFRLLLLIILITAICVFGVVIAWFIVLLISCLTFFMIDIYWLGYLIIDNSTFYS